MVHKKVQALLGIHYTSKNAVFDLPDPLPLNAPLRYDDDGCRLWNPDWSQDSNFPLNKTFITKVVAVLEDDEGTLAEKEVRNNHKYVGCSSSLPVALILACVSGTQSLRTP